MRNENCDLKKLQTFWIDIRAVDAHFTLKSFLLKNSSSREGRSCRLLNGRRVHCLKDHAPLISSLKPGVVVIEETPAKNSASCAWRLRRSRDFGLTILANQAITGRFERPRSKQDRQLRRRNHPRHE